MSDTGESRQSFIRVSLETAYIPLSLPGDCIPKHFNWETSFIEDNVGQYMYMYLGSDLTIIASCSNIIR